MAQHYRRRVGDRTTPPLMLIVCEGAKTEPKYFEGFRIKSARVKVVGYGGNTISVVEEAIRIRDSFGNPFKFIWCVFDRDSFPKARFNAALSLAARNNISVAYSNEAFELWYLLHFNFYNTATSRDSYKHQLTQQLGRPYLKNDDNIYFDLLHLQGTAIRNAKRLIALYSPSSPYEDNPSTTVFKLVEQLIVVARKQKNQR